jgi:hypothetical protein
MCICRSLTFTLLVTLPVYLLGFNMFPSLFTTLLRLLFSSFTSLPSRGIYLTPFSPLLIEVPNILTSFRQPAHPPRLFWSSLP